MSDSTTCTSCGASVPAGATFCTNCGAKVAGAAPEPTAAQAPSDPAAAPEPPASAGSTPDPAAGPPPDADATRVDQPGLGDPTQVFRPPPAPDAPASPGAAPWQPAEAASAPAHPPAAAPWDPPPSSSSPPWPQPPPSGGPGGWAQPAPPQQPPPGQWGAPPAAGQWGAPAPAPASGGKAPSPMGGIAAAVGAVLVLVGLFLPWLGNNQDNERYEASGWDLTTGDRALESIDPYIVLALGVVGLVLAALLFSGVARPVMRIAAVVAGVAVVAILARDWMTITDVVADDGAVGSSFEVAAQFGFYLTIAGGVVLALAALAPAKTSSART